MFRFKKEVAMLRKIQTYLGSSLFSVLLLAVTGQSFAQAGLEDDRIMLQGFYWESYRHGHIERPDFNSYGGKQWYDIVKDNAPAIRDGHFDLVWLPPPAYAGEYSAGYNPKEYFNLNNSYGNFEQHRVLLETLLSNGIEPIADVVINHRDGVGGWAAFRNPDWGTWAICRSDEAFYAAGSEVKGTPEQNRGPEEDRPVEYANHGGTTYQYGDFRDICHSDRRVRRDILKYLKQLRSAGYRGWRFDMVHGYHAKYVAFYNRHTQPTFSVGEYDWDKHDQTRGWIWHSATLSGRFDTASAAFDFTTLFTLKDNKSNYLAWYGWGDGIGLLGDNTDGLPWKNKAVTFLENHDTGYRTNEDGSPQEHHTRDSFLNSWEVEQGYAYILTHPGVPCVYWKHYFDWGCELRSKITALNNARKVAGINAGSKIFVQHNAQSRGVYAVMVQGRHGRLYVRIGGGDNDWQPNFSNYQDYREYAYGSGWKVWVGLPGNPEVKSASLPDPLPIPTYIEPGSIQIPDSMLDL
jgi:alpha-amylase